MMMMMMMMMMIQVIFITMNMIWQRNLQQ